MVTLKILTAYLNEKVWRDIEDALEHIDGVHLEGRCGAIDEVFSDIGKEALPDVVIVEMDADAAEIERIRPELERVSEATQVFVTHQSSNIDMMRTLMRLGIRDFIPQPIDSQDLVNQITKVISEKRRRIMTDKGRLASVFTFMNAKGGAGASTLAVNVAAILARKYKLKVALIDFDIQLGADALFLDVFPKSTVYDALMQAARVDPVFLRALMTPHESGLQVLPSPANLSSVSDISPDDVKQILDAAADSFDVVIVDLPRLFTQWTIEVLKYSEKILLVLQNSISAIRDAKVILDNLPKQGIALESIEIVNNRAEAAMGAVTIKDLKVTVHRERLHRIRTDFKAAINAQNQGKLVADVSSHSKLKKDLENLAAYLNDSIRQRNEAEGKVPAQKGFFARLTGG